MKVLFYARGPGETSQAYSVCDYFSKKGLYTWLVLRKPINAQFFSNFQVSFPIKIAPDLKSLKDLIERIHSDTVFLFNSKVFNSNNQFINHSPWPSIPTFTLDSNWLFSPKITPYRPIMWAKRYFVNLPRQVFNLGLKDNGGGFHIPKEFLKKIKIVGLVPSYRPLKEGERSKIRERLGLKKSEKFIFCYYSGFGAGEREWVLENLLRACRLLKEKGMKIKILPIGVTNRWRAPEILEISPKKLNIRTFYQYLASADLVFQHQGLGTLAQVISARIPVIANITVDRNNPLPSLHKWEVSPFAKLGLCKLLFRTTPRHQIAKTIFKLLTDKKAIVKMRQAQEKHFEAGEENLYQSFIKTIS